MIWQANFIEDFAKSLSITSESNHQRVVQSLGQCFSTSLLERDLL